MSNRHYAEAHPLTFHLLGTPQIRWQNIPLKISRRQARSLLYRLATDMLPISRDQLAFLFWPDSPDATGRRNLNRLLSYVRKQMPDPDCLILNRNSVQLNPKLVWSDAWALTDIPDDAELELLSLGIEWYRGRFLAGFSQPDAPEFEQWLAQTARHIEHHLLLLLRKIIHAHEAAHNFTTAISYAQLYLAIDEMAEEMHRQLIKLFGLTGDRAAVTRQFEQLSLILERELAVSPLEETRAIYESALRGNTTLSASTRPITPQWSVLPSLQIPLVGRESTLDKLTNAINGLSAGGLILISGEPGVGKSRLVQSFALSSKRLVLTGNSHLATHSTPYQPLTQALRQALQHPDLWKGMRSIWLAEVSRLLPELKETFPDLPKPVDIASDQAQARLFTGITHIFEKLSLSSPLLLCLDDLHWADMATLNWLINVSTHRVNSPFIILATCRSEDITALADVHQAFRRMNRLVDIEISGLNEKAIAKILRMVELPELSEEIEPLTTRLVQATGGNTFFLLETIRLIQENEHTSVPQGSLPLSATVKEAIHRRLQKITPLGHQTLQAAAVLAPFIQPNFIKITSGRDDLELADALDELNSRQLLQPAGNGFEFSHELLRMVVYESLTPWRRLILHRRAAEAISSQSGQEELPLLTAIAKHFDSAGAYREAIRAYQRAATSAAAVYAYEEAIGHLKQACALLPEAEIEHDNYEFLHENLGKNLARLAKFQPARASFRDALNCIKPEDLLGRTRLHHQIANTYLKQLHYDKAEYHLQQAQSDLDNYEGKTEETWLQLWIDVQLNYQYLCFCLIKIERLDKLEPELAPVVSQFGRGDQQRRFAEQSILTTLHKEQYRPSEETLALIQSQLDSAISSGQPEYITISRFDLGSNLLHAGQLDLAEPLLLGALSGAEQICLNMVAARCLAFLVTLYRLKGDPERTAEFVDRAAEASQAVGSHHFYAHSLACQSWLNYRKGNWDRALPLAEKADNLFVKSNVPWTWLAKVLVMAIYSNTDRLSAAVESAHGMLAPGQQRLPAGLAQPLQEAVTYWKEGDAMATRRELQNSILAAKLIGYL